MMRFGLFLLIMLAANTGHAGVIYNWESLGATDDFEVAEGQLIITNSAYREGSFSTDYFVSSGYEPDFRYANSPILKASLGIARPGGPVINPVVVFPRREVGVSPRYELRSGISIIPGGLAGGIYMYTIAANLYIDADDSGIWTASGYSSDYPTTEECFDIRNDCSGATGRWVLDEDSIRGIGVPEPGSMLLLALGCVATFTTWRLKKS